MKMIYLACCILLFAGCSEQQKENAASVESTKQQTAQPIEKATQVIQDETKEPTTILKTPATETQELQETTDNTVTAVDNAPDETSQPAKEAAELTQADGTAIFSKCVSCHGAKAEKSALNKSRIIAGWPKEQIVDALTGYQNGSYGGAMKTLMAGQVKPLSPKDIEAVAQYISTLKAN